MRITQRLLKCLIEVGKSHNVKSHGCLIEFLMVAIGVRVFDFHVFDMLVGCVFQIVLRCFVMCARRVDGVSVCLLNLYYCGRKYRPPSSRSCSGL